MEPGYLSLSKGATYQMRRLDGYVRFLLLFAAVTCTVLIGGVTLFAGGWSALFWLLLGASVQLLWHYVCEATRRRPKQ
jgi:hypothetical protein